jgi:hypothetical protein
MVILDDDWLCDILFHYIELEEQVRRDLREVATAAPRCARAGLSVEP